MCFINPQPFTKTIFAICKGIEENTCSLDTKKYKIGAMDIACGYHSYLFSIARCHKQVSHIIPYTSKHSREKTFAVHQQCALRRENFCGLQP